MKKYKKFCIEFIIWIIYYSVLQQILFCFKEQASDSYCWLYAFFIAVLSMAWVRGLDKIDDKYS